MHEFAHQAKMIGFGNQIEISLNFVDLISDHFNQGDRMKPAKFEKLMAKQFLNRLASSNLEVEQKYRIKEAHPIRRALRQMKAVKLIEPPKDSSGTFVLNLTQAEFSRQS